jgi:hypothetical protein
MVSSNTLTFSLLNLPYIEIFVNALLGPLYDPFATDGSASILSANVTAS